MTSADPGAGRRQLPEPCVQTPLPNVWIFQASPKFSNVKGAVRSIEEPVCLVRQYRDEIRPGDKVCLWECGSRGGIIALAEALEKPRVQPEPAEQFAFIREGEKFAGDQMRVKLRIRKQIAPGIPRKFLLSRADSAIYYTRKSWRRLCDKEGYFPPPSCTYRTYLARLTISHKYGNMTL